MDKKDKLMKQLSDSTEKSEHLAKELRAKIKELSNEMANIKDLKTITEFEQFKKISNFMTDKQKVLTKDLEFELNKQKSIRKQLKSLNK